MNKNELIERSIIKTYRKKIWSKFIKAVKDFELIENGDKIAVCISGGKDSFLLAKCMQELQKHSIYEFSLEFIVMNPGYSEDVLNKIKENLNTFEIPAHIFKTEVFKIADTSKSPCYLCAKMRRGYLYNYASKLGCNKIALGHHFDDVVETILLNLFFNGSYSSMMPKLKSDNFENIELIRPLYLIREDDIINFKNYNNLEFVDCACPVAKKNEGKRKEMKELVKKLEKYNKDVAKSIFTSTKNVNLNTVISYQKNREKFNFLDDYKK